MKISIQSKMAAAVAAGVIAVTAGALAQSQSSGQSPNEYAPTTQPSVNTHLGQRGYNDTSTANQDGQSFADESTSSTRQKKSTNHRSRMSTKHRTHRTHHNQDTDTNGAATTPGD